MNETTNLNTELLTADARGRKHVPFAVFAVILIHIALFLVLLVAAGCRAKARAKRNLKPASEMLAQQQPAPASTDIALSAPAASTPAPSTNAPPPLTLPPDPLLIQPMVVTEPPVEKRPAAQPTVRKAAQKTAPAPAQRPTASSNRKAKVYVVKAGDTVEKIAKMHRTSVDAIKAENNLKDHMLRPGQQLRVSSQQPKISKEV